MPLQGTRAMDRPIERVESAVGRLPASFRDVNAMFR